MSGTPTPRLSAAAKGYINRREVLIKNLASVAVLTCTVNDDERPADVTAGFAIKFCSVPGKIMGNTPARVPPNPATNSGRVFYSNHDICHDTR